MKRTVFFIILFFTLFNIYAEDLKLSEWLEKNNGGFRWAPLKNSGEILFDDSIYGFKLDQIYLVKNYREKHRIPPFYMKGIEIYIPEDAAKIILGEEDVDMDLNYPESSGHRIAAILIDPGHGGKDSGAVGRHRVNNQSMVVQEKDVVLDISKNLYKKLKSKYKDKKILLTRNDDSYPDLESRVEMANNVRLKENEAVVYLSVHANASFNTKAKGFEVWYLPPDYRRDLIDEKSVEKGNEEIIPILNTMLEEEYTLESILLARNIINGLKISTGNKTINRGLKEETWFVVRNAKMPSVLIEVGFVSNEEEAQLLNSDDYLKKLTDGIYNGIEDFIENIENMK
jgi:N-acetylmuramoyl-L-alanine amidase